MAGGTHFSRLQGPALQSVPGIALAVTLKERRDEFYGHRNEERRNGMQLFLSFREVPRSLVLFELVVSVNSASEKEVCSIGPFRLGLRPRPWLKQYWLTMQFVCTAS